MRVVVVPIQLEVGCGKATERTVVVPIQLAIGKLVVGKQLLLGAAVVVPIQLKLVVGKQFWMKSL